MLQKACEVTSLRQAQRSQPGDSPAVDTTFDSEVRPLGPYTPLYLTHIGRSWPHYTSASSRWFWPSITLRPCALRGDWDVRHDDLPCSNRVPKRHEETDASRTQSRKMKGPWGLRQSSRYEAGHHVIRFPMHDNQPSS